MKPKSCNHEFELITTGGMHYSGDEVWDDIEDHYICRYCGAEKQVDGDTVQLFEELDPDEIPF